MGAGHPMMHAVLLLSGVLAFHVTAEGTHVALKGVLNGFQNIQSRVFRKMQKEWADVDREIEDYLKGKGALPPESNPVSYPTVGGGMHWVYRLGGRRPHVGVMP